jgi:hypothetical protein
VYILWWVCSRWERSPRWLLLLCIVLVFSFVSRHVHSFFGVLYTEEKTVGLFLLSRLLGWGLCCNCFLLPLWRRVKHTESGRKRIWDGRVSRDHLRHTKKEKKKKREHGQRDRSSSFSPFWESLCVCNKLERPQSSLFVVCYYHSSCGGWMGGLALSPFFQKWGCLDSVLHNRTQTDDVSGFKRKLKVVAQVNQGGFPMSEEFFFFTFKLMVCSFRFSQFLFTY